MRRRGLPVTFGGMEFDGSVTGRAVTGALAEEVSALTRTTPFLKIAMHSDVGCERRLTVNEDSALVLEAQGGGLFAIADGMGGHAAGEVASQLALEELRESYARGRAAAPERLAAAVQAAGAAVHRHATGSAAGMGTTLTALVVDGGAALIANVGDSRAYLRRAGQLTRLTRDHSWVAEQVRLGIISEREARTHQWRNIVSNALGGEERVRLDLLGLPLERGDRLLLCSDGLSDVLDDPEIAELLGRGLEPAKLAAELVAAANAAGGPDNITVIVVEVRTGAARPRYTLPALHQDGPVEALSIRAGTQRRGALTYAILGVVYLALLSMIVFPEQRPTISALSVVALLALLAVLRLPARALRSDERAGPTVAGQTYPERDYPGRDYQEASE